MVDELNASKKDALTESLKIDDVQPFNEEELTFVERELSEVVMGYNFDSFSFLFELLNLAETNSLSLVEAFKMFQIDSLELLEKYKGSNCAGLSLNLQDRLSSRAVRTEIAPSYGQYLVIKEADDYAQIRTVDAVGVLRRGVNNVWVFLAPGLTIDKPILVEEGFAVQSFDRRYEVRNVTDRGFTIITTKPDGERLERFFGFERFVNPDLSSQKNLLRCRIKYQITKQYATHREQITFNLATRNFKVKTLDTDSIFSIEEFATYLRENGENLSIRFNNPYLVKGFQILVKYVDEIRSTLLIPELQIYVQES